MIGRFKAVRGKGALQPRVEQIVDRRATTMTKEYELAVVRLLGDAREDLVVLRKVFVQRLPAPEHGGVGAKAQLLAGHRDRFGGHWLVIDRQVRQPDQFLGVAVLYTSPSPRDGLLSRMPS